MTTVVVQNIVKDTIGNTLAGTVTIELIGTDPGEPGFVDYPGGITSDYTINVAASKTFLSSNGLWTAALEPNANIDPPNTQYRVTETVTGGSKSYLIIVPVAAGPLWVGDILAP